FLTLQLPPTSPLLPYTTLFRSPSTRTRLGLPYPANGSTRGRQPRAFCRRETTARHRSSIRAARWGRWLGVAWVVTLGTGAVCGMARDGVLGRGWRVNPVTGRRRTRSGDGVRAGGAVPSVAA